MLSQSNSHLIVTIVIVSTLFGLATGVLTPRTKMCQKAVALGVTFYKAPELETILICIEPTFFADPNNTDALISKIKDCVIQNSGSKVTQALSLYNNGNACLKPDDLISTAEKLSAPFFKIVKPMANLVLKTLNNCKKTNKQTGNKKVDVCMNKSYDKSLASITRPFVNTVCTKMSKKMNKKQWDCAKQYAPKVVNVAGYACYKIVKKA